MHIKDWVNIWELPKRNWVNDKQGLLREIDPDSNIDISKQVLHVILWIPLTKSILKLQLKPEDQMNTHVETEFVWPHKEEGLLDNDKLTTKQK